MLRLSNVFTKNVFTVRSYYQIKIIKCIRYQNKLLQLVEIKLRSNEKSTGLLRLDDFAEPTSCYIMLYNRC